jgi:Fe-Mn family superoxide dismutase
MIYQLPKLAYLFNALEPYVDEQTMQLHYSKHHQTYLDKFLAAIEPFDNLKSKPIESLLQDLNALPEDVRPAVRNMGGGYYNHNLFWQSLAPESKLSEFSSKKLSADFGSFETFKQEFTQKALGLFGSGWTWLVLGVDNKLKIVTTSNQDNPISTEKVKVVLALDVWEHAYYLKYQNRRADWVENWWNVVNWEMLDLKLK